MFQSHFANHRALLAKTVDCDINNYNQTIRPQTTEYLLIDCGITITINLIDSILHQTSPTHMFEDKPPNDTDHSKITSTPYILRQKHGMLLLICLVNQSLSLCGEVESGRYAAVSVWEGGERR